MPLLRRKLDPVDIRKRDLELLRGLFESRVMSARHIAILYFGGKKEAAKKRLQKLKAAGLIGDRARRSFEPSVLYLTYKALKLLDEQGILAEYPPFDLPMLDKRANVSDLTLRHELEIIDVKAAFHEAMKTTKALRLVEFSTWPLLYQFEVSRPGYGGAEILVKPDGFIRFSQRQDGGILEHAFFLEVDRSTETLETLIARAGCYQDYYKSGGFAVRNGGTRLEYRQYPFRILMVFKTAERRNNCAERLLQCNPPIYTQVCLSTFDEVISKPLGTIWITPADYRAVTKGTPFDSDQKRGTRGYKRQTERELLVESRIKKGALLA
jgi:hypothetical protein